MTHGVFLARIEADPELAGVSAVLFDEVHERSLDNDLALALALDFGGRLAPRPAACGDVGDAQFRAIPGHSSAIRRRSRVKERAFHWPSTMQAVILAPKSSRRWRPQFEALFASTKDRSSPSFPALPR